MSLFNLALGFNQIIVAIGLIQINGNEINFLGKVIQYVLYVFFLLSGAYFFDKYFKRVNRK